MAKWGKLWYKSVAEKEAAEKEDKKNRMPGKQNRNKRWMDTKQEPKEAFKRKEERHQKHLELMAKQVKREATA